jgi:hypothetical protein
VFFPSGSVSYWASFCLLSSKVCVSLVSSCLLSSKVCVSLGVVLHYFPTGLCRTGGRSVFIPQGFVSCGGAVLCSFLQDLCLAGCRSVFCPQGPVSHWLSLYIFWDVQIDVNEIISGHVSFAWGTCKDQTQIYFSETFFQLINCKFGWVNGKPFHICWLFQVSEISNHTIDPCLHHSLVCDTPAVAIPIHDIKHKT